MYLGLTLEFVNNLENSIAHISLQVLTLDLKSIPFTFFRYFCISTQDKRLPGS